MITLLMCFIVVDLCLLLGFLNCIIERLQKVTAKLKRKDKEE